VVTSNHVACYNIGQTLKDINLLVRYHKRKGKEKAKKGICNIMVLKIEIGSRIDNLSKNRNRMNQPESTSPIGNIIFFSKKNAYLLLKKYWKNYKKLFCRKNHVLNKRLHSNNTLIQSVTTSIDDTLSLFFKALLIRYDFLSNSSF
jgi:hypothetical protein